MKLKIWTRFCLVACTVAPGCGLERVDVTGDSLVYPTATVTYSVGASTDDLKTGSPVLTITGGTATLSVPQPATVGPGDVIEYGATQQRAFVATRQDARTFTLLTHRGEIPADASDAQIHSIERVFNNLTQANALSGSSSYLDTRDLVTGHYQLNWACYNDAPMDDTLELSGWNTGRRNFIRIYAPVGTDEIGTRQRHTGRAGTGFALRPVRSSPADPFDVIEIDDAFVRIEGIEINGSMVTNAGSLRGIVASHSRSEIRVDQCIIHDLASSTSPSANDVIGLYQVSGAAIRISNSIVHDIENNSPDAQSAAGMRFDADLGEVFAHNNTVFNVTNTQSFNYARGLFVAGAGIVHLSNNYVGGSISTNGADSDFAISADAVLVTAANNVSSDETALFWGNAVGQIHQTAYTTYFVRPPEDLHLVADSEAVWGLAGVDLSDDAGFPVVEDIDARPRDATPDIGADEFGN